MIIVKSIQELDHIPENIPSLFYFNNKILILKSENQYKFPSYQDIDFDLNTQAVFIMNIVDNKPILVADLKSDDISDHFTFINTHADYQHFTFEQRHFIARSFGYVYWYRMHQFCGRCSSALIFHASECSMFCSTCQHHFYPKINPSMIVLVYRGRELLLARSPHFLPGMYSTLAGYVAPGETLEETVEREVMEEVGIKIKNIRYAGSQPWPFPDTLMIGFYAEYAGGEIKIDEKEIEAAAWFTPENLPPLPRTISIGWQLIDGFIKRWGQA